MKPLKSPLIKPSHKGLLHSDLGIPMGQKIPVPRLEAAKHSSSPAIRKRANFALNFNEHGTHGEVTGISSSEHQGQKYARISVAHGVRTKPKKGSMNGPGYDDRPESSVYVPAAHASRYHIGQKVGVGLAGLPDDEPADGYDDAGTDDDGDEQQGAMSAYHRMQRSITSRKPTRS